MRTIIIEVGSKLELLRRLEKLTAGNMALSKFLFISSHADKQVLVFGRKQWEYYRMEVADVTERAARSADKVLDASGEIILIGCETRKSRGIADKMSREFKRTVHGASFKASGIQKISAQPGQGTNSIRFQIAFIR